MDSDIACNNMCDICDNSVASSHHVDVTDYAKAALDILNAAVTKEVRVTAAKLVEALQGRGANNIKISRWKGGQSNKEQVEQIVAMLLVEQYLQEDMHYTPYSVISYIVPGVRDIKSVKIRFLAGKNKVKDNKKKRKVSDSSVDDFVNEKASKASYVISSDDES